LWPMKSSVFLVVMVHVASSRRLRGIEVGDGWVDVADYIGLFYPNFVVFTVLGPRGILVF
jgi:hypothetical protein